MAACSDPTSSNLNEFVKFTYDLSSPAAHDTLTLPIPAGSVMCARSGPAIYIEAKSGIASIIIDLKSAATMPAPAVLAETNSKGIASVDVIVPSVSGDMAQSGPVAFSTTAISNAFSCTLKINGPDPFKSFDGTFSCASGSTTPGRRLTITDGSYHAVPCP